MNKQQLEDYAIGFDELGFEPTTLIPIEEMEHEIKKYQNMFKELLKTVEAVDLIKKCYYFSSFSGQLMKSSYGFENPQDIKRIEELLK